MNTEERRILLDKSFDRALETVLAAFLREGFTVKPVDGGDLHRQSASDPLRYAQLEASLPEISFRAAGRSVPASTLLACRLSLFELTGSCTLVTAENPIDRYPLLSALVPQVTEHVGHALRLVSGGATNLNAA